jgi:hypothetical protein
MKTVLKLIFILPVVFALFACNDTMGEPDSKLSDVKSLIEPASGRSVVLDPSPTATVYFE